MGAIKTFLLVFISTGFVNSQTIIELNDGSEHISIGKLVNVYTDREADLSINEILNYRYLKWQKSNEEVPNFGIRSAATWLHFKVTDYSSQTNWLLHVNYAPLEHVDLYYFNHSGNIHVKKGGCGIPHYLWEIKDRTHVFNLPIVKNDTTEFYLRVASQSSTTIPISICSEAYYNRWDKDNLLFLGAFYGVLLVMMLYNFGLYFSTKESVYLFYVFYLASYGLYQLTFDGLNFQYIWQGSPHWNTISYAFFYGFHLVFGALFIKAFLQVRKYSSLLDKILTFEILFGLILTTTSLFIPYPILNTSGQIILFFLIPLHIFMGIFVYHKGFQPGKYFLFATSILATGILSRFARGLGFLPVSIWSTYGYQIGSFLEMVLLSSALGNKIKILKQEKRIEMEKVRRDISSDLHDEIGSNLGSISLISQRLKKNPQIDSNIKDQLQEITDTTLQTAENLREIIWFINPVKRTAEQFIFHLKTITGKLLKDIDYKLTYNEPDDEFTNLVIQRNLYLMYKEILHNILKHSCATIVTIDIKFQNDKIAFLIKDNGKGFELQSSQNGMGLNNMHTRAKSINANLKITSGNQQGTEISVILGITQMRYGLILKSNLSYIKNLKTLFHVKRKEL